MPKNKVNLFTGFAREFEHFTDHLIPFLVIGIAIVLILENPLWALVHLDEFEPWITIFDSVVVFFFVSDLVFKWLRTRELKKFVKLYWIDIVAVFPFYLFFRAYGELVGLLRIGEEATEATQKALHEAVLLREAGFYREAELAAREARLVKKFGVIGRMVRSGARFLRAMKGRLYTTYAVFVEIRRRHKKEHR